MSADEEEIREFIARGWTEEDAQRFRAAAWWVLDAAEGLERGFQVKGGSEAAKGVRELLAKYGEVIPASLRFAMEYVEAGVP